MGDSFSANYSNFSLYISNSRIAGISLNDTAHVLENCVEKMDERIDSLNLSSKIKQKSHFDSVRSRSTAKNPVGMFCRPAPGGRAVAVGSGVSVGALAQAGNASNANIIRPTRSF